MKRRAIGIDLGGTNLRVAIVEIEKEKARICDQKRIKVGDEKSPEIIADRIYELVRALDPKSSLPIGMGIAAMLHGKGGIVANAPNLEWRDIPFGPMLAQRLNRAVWLENDLSAISWGESRFGGGLGYRDMLCVFVGTGIGAGAVLNGHPYRGAGNVALEFGHLKVESIKSGLICGCGQRGCLEAYAGGRALMELARGINSTILKDLGGEDKVHAGHLDLAARSGCSESQAIIERAGRYLGHALADMVTLFNPGCLILGGTVWENCERYAEIAIETFKSHVTSAALPWVHLAKPTLGDDAGVLGAADLSLVEGLDHGVCH